MSVKLLARVMPRLLGAAKDVHLHAGEALFRIGAPADSVYFIASGRVAVEPPSIRTYSERGFVGSSDVLLERARTHGVVAASDLHALAFPAILWLEILEDSPEAAMTAISAIAAEVDALYVGGRFTAASASPREHALPSATLSLVERLVALRAAHPLRRAGIPALASLATTAEEVRLVAGECLFARDAPRRAHYVVAHGEIETTRASTARVDRYATGSLVMSVASFVRHTEFDANAACASTVLRLSYEDVFDVSEDHFDLARSLLVWLEEQRDALSAGPQ